MRPGRWWSSPGRPVWQYVPLMVVLALVIVTLIGPLWYDLGPLGKSVAATSTLAGSHWIVRSYLERNDEPDDE